MLNSKKWKSFKFSEVFKIVDGYYNKRPPIESKGDIPFLGGTKYNNGVTGFYSKETILSYDKVGNLGGKDLTKRIYQGNCLAVTNNGSVGNVYYQRSLFTCSHDVTILYLKNKKMNQKIALFLIPLIKKVEKALNMQKNGDQ